jgi:hypothetical protein
MIPLEKARRTREEMIWCFDSFGLELWVKRFSANASHGRSAEWHTLIRRSSKMMMAERRMSVACSSFRDR